MCTVSIVPLQGGHVFTFNRDENTNRYTTQFISRLQLGYKELVYAKDSKAGGSWFVADSLGNAAMLFNGAFQKHTKEAAYQKSRGIILLQLAAAQNMLDYFSNEGLQGVEPFSIVLYEHKLLYRLTWDGASKHVTPLLNDRPYIFSSATLYDEEVQQQRREWLHEWLQQQEVTSDRVYQFHREYKQDDKQNGLIIQRPDGCSTLSISQLAIRPEAMWLRHVDIKTGNVYELPDISVAANYAPLQTGPTY